MKNNTIHTINSAKQTDLAAVPVEFNKQAYQRNRGILNDEDQQKLQHATIAIPGMGGVGGSHLINLVRTGVLNFHIADFDTYETANINRQYGAKYTTLGKKKAKVMEKEAMEINPLCRITSFNEGINEDNIDAFLEGVDVVVDSLDFFKINIRRLLFSKAREKNIPIITAGPIGFSTAMMVFMPETMSFDRYFNLHDHQSEEQQLVNFFVGLAPKGTQFKYVDKSTISMKTKKGPSLSLSCQLSAAAATTEVIRILCNKQGIKAAPHYFQYDLLTRDFHKRKLWWGNRNILQKIKINYIKNKLDKEKRNA